MKQRQKNNRKKVFSNSLDYYLVNDKKLLITLKTDYFQKNLDKIPTHESICEATTELATEPTKHKKCKLILQQKPLNEIIANEKDINDAIFCNYFKYQNLSSLAKKSIRATQAENERLVNNFNDELID